MKNGDFYDHFKGGEYFFDCIALPLKDSYLSNRIHRMMAASGTARYHEDTHDLQLFNLDGATFIDSDVPHVIYQSEKHYDTDFVYAREVDDFFGHKQDADGKYIKRFTLRQT